MIRPRLRYLVLFLNILMVISGITISWLIQNNFGTVRTSEIDLYTSDGVLIHSTLQVPRGASDKNPIPGVVVIHGSMQSKEWMMAFGIELARRNFVVVTIDAASHGNSGYLSDWNSDRGGVTAVEFLANLDYVNKIALVGHSMGAAIVQQTLNLTSTPIDAIVFIGGVFQELTEWANTTYPKNLLISVGKYDELFNIPDIIDSLNDVFGTALITPETQYGDFNYGTARKLVISASNHLFETIDPEIIGETIQWLENSLKGSSISVGILIYPINIFGGLIATTGLILSIFPLMAILLDFNIFKDLKEKTASNYHINTRGYWSFGLLNGIVSLSAFLPALLLPYYLPFSIPFPQSRGFTVSLWFIIVSLVTLVILMIIHGRINQKRNLTYQDYAVDHLTKNKLKIVGKNLIKSGIVAFILLLWLFLIEIFVDTFLALDFRIFLPFFQDLTIIRLLIAPFYILFTIPFFIVEGMWFSGLLRTSKKETWSKSYFHQTTKAIFIKCLPYASIILVQSAISLILGQAFISGTIGYNLIFLWIFTPFFVVSTSILIWSYHLTNRIYIGAFLNAFIFSWGMAAILSLT